MLLRLSRLSEALLDLLECQQASFFQIWVLYQRILTIIIFGMQLCS